MRIKIKTTKRVEAVDITNEIEKLTKDIKEGVIFIYSPHTTAGITINEGFDESVMIDLNNKLSELIPHNDKYLHFEGNSDAHIKVSLIGNEAFVFVENGKLKLGRWQRIFFLEFDGPREREVWIKIINFKNL